MGTEHSISSPQEMILIDDRILTRHIKPEGVSPGGVILPETVIKDKQEQVQASVVVNVGPGRFTSEGKYEAMLPIEPGDIVFHAQYLGYLIKIPDETGKDIEYRVFGQHDLLGYRKKEGDE